MATVVRITDPNVAAWAAAHNDLKKQVGAGSHFHLDASEETVTAADATSLATSLALCNNMIGVLRFHFADTLACKAADATSLPALGAAVDLASAITAANLMRTSWATHIASTAVHYNADATNTISGTPAASDQTTLNTLLTAFKPVVNAHLADAPSSKSIRAIAM